MANEYSNENIDFWAASEEYKQIFEKSSAPKMVRVSPSAPTDAADTQSKIVADYIKPGAPNEVNISSSQRSEVLTKSASGERAKLFDAAQREVHDLMYVAFVFPQLSPLLYFVQNAENAEC